MFSFLMYFHFTDAPVASKSVRMTLSSSSSDEKKAQPNDVTVVESQQLIDNTKAEIKSLNISSAIPNEGKTVIAPSILARAAMSNTNPNNPIIKKVEANPLVPSKKTAASTKVSIKRALAKKAGSGLAINYLRGKNKASIHTIH